MGGVPFYESQALTLSPVLHHLWTRNMAVTVQQTKMDSVVSERFRLMFTAFRIRNYNVVQRIVDWSTLKNLRVALLRVALCKLLYFT